MNRRLLKIRLRTAAAALLAALMLLIYACDRRPLEVYYLDRARVTLHMDWLSQYGKRPEGMTVNIYDGNGRLYSTFSTNDVDSTDLTLPVGRYKTIIYNNDSTYFYRSFTFNNLYDFDLYQTWPQENRSRRNLLRWDAGTRYAWEPADSLGVAVDSFEITDEMLQYQLQFIDYHDRADAVGALHRFHLYQAAHPMQTMLHVRVHVWGLENMARLEANLSGMADGCSMAHMWRNTTTSTVYYDTELWGGLRWDGDRSADGWITFDIPTWGEPHGKELAEQRDSTDNVLRMNFILGNGEERYWEFNVGHIIEYHEPQKDPEQLTAPDVLRDLYIVINREIPLLPEVPIDDKNQGAGFNAHVDPWDYGGEVDLGTF